MASKMKLSRREFVATTAATIALPAIIPSGVLAAPGRQGANDRIRIGYIGVGGMGTGHVAPDAVALCDVDRNHLANAVHRVAQGAPFLTNDFRRLLERNDIDAVIIATPDHWHAIQTVMACQAGKHVYCEKPACRTIEEGRAMTAAARRYNRMVQIGAQGRSNPNARAACQFVRNGGIGKLKRVEVWHPVNFAWPGSADPRPAKIPSSLDWNMWLGPARWADYNPLRAHFNFRWFMEYGGGFLRDRGNHVLSIASWLADADKYNGKVVCEATGKPMIDGLYDAPETMEVKWEFYNPNWTLTWSQPGKANPRFPGEWGATYYGDKDDLVVTGGDGSCDTESKAKEFKVPAGGVEIFNSPGHRENWLNCIRDGSKPVMDVDVGARVATLCIVGNISWILGRKVTFDYASGRFVGDEEANRFIGAAYRSPWTL